MRVVCASSTIILQAADYKITIMIEIIPRLSNQACENLKNYKYSSGEPTYADRLMAPFWEGFTKLIPKVSSIKFPRMSVQTL